MTNTQPPAEPSWNEHLDPARDPNDLLTVLEDLATREEITGVALACLKLLAHSDSEVRLWAAEALESSAQPDQDETIELTQWLDQLLDQQTAWARKHFVWPTADRENTPQPKSPTDSEEEELAASLLADQLYWNATMLGRIGAAASGADPVLARLESLGEDAQAEAFHAAAARAARMRRRIAS